MNSNSPTSSNNLKKAAGLPPIVQTGDPVLREIAQTVATGDISSPKIRDIIANMKAVLATQKDGVALAAPQIGLPLRIFVVSDKVLTTADKDFKSTGHDLVFVNPEIIKLSRGKTLVEEGCLSVRWLYGKVKRSKQATIRAYDENGRVFERGGSGLLAQVFQHEVDHLDGKLFTDTAIDLEDMPPEKTKRA